MNNFVPKAIHTKCVKVVYLVLVSSIICLLYYKTYIRCNNNIKTNIWYEVVVNETVEVKYQDRKLKYILLWTNPDDTPFVYFGKGSSVFENKTCRWSNCHVTGDRNLLGNYTNFDVIVFSSSRLSQILEAADIPIRRSMHQKYVFASVESAAYYTICTDEWNGFFNWTWTYKLNSDAIWGYINVRNATGETIGPKQDMHWMESRYMEDIVDDLRQKLRSKTRVAAWFVSNCETLSLREEFVKEIEFELNKYKLSIDIFGRCGKYLCPKEIMTRCLKLLEKKYFFYFAFENSFSEDYVTEKIMYALQHNTVPVVYGGANYSRFLPRDSYLDALQMGPAKLAREMYELSNDPAGYAQYFKWKRYYSYHYRHESPDTDDYCRFCAMLNDEILVTNTSYYNNITAWWSGKNIDLCQIVNKNII